MPWIKHKSTSAQHWRIWTNNQDKTCHWNVNHIDSPNTKTNTVIEINKYGWQVIDDVESDEQVINILRNGVLPANCINEIIDEYIGLARQSWSAKGKQTLKNAMTRAAENRIAKAKAKANADGQSSSESQSNSENQSQQEIETEEKRETEKKQQQMNENKQDPIQPLVEEIAKRLEIDKINSVAKAALDEVLQKMDDEEKALDNKIADAVKNVESTKSAITQIEIIDRRKEPVEITNIGRQHKQFPLLLNLVNLDLVPYVWGPTGSGKTMGAFKVAETLKLPAFRIALCAQTSKSEIFGYNDAHGKFVPGISYEPYVNGGVMIFDEVDNGNANTNSSLNMLTDGNDCVFPNGRQAKNPNFKVICTANTVGSGATRSYVGRAPQDQALLNRLPQIHWGYDTEFEEQLAWVEYKSYGGTDEKEFKSKLHDFWCMRMAIDELALVHILSTRNLLHLMRMLGSKSVDFKDITRAVIARGIDKDQWKKLIAKADEILKRQGWENHDEAKTCELELVDDGKMKTSKDGKAPF